MTGQEVIIASIFSNLISLVLLLVCWKKKNTGRLLFSALFIWAAFINWKTAYGNPGDYLNYSRYAVPFYKNIITGEFSRHITGYVSVIATCQLLIGLCLLARGIIVKVACAGGIIFLLAIAPLGMGAAFPFSITASIGLLLLYKHNFTLDIFRNKWWV